jgi:hypothetical protein
MSDPTTLLSEHLISLYDAARRLPPGRRQRPVSFSCVLRWIVRGIPGPDGHRVRLQGIRLGGRWLTSQEALVRFAKSLTPDLTDNKTLRVRTPRQRHRSSERAATRLEKVGI